jgi:hypothetical protein
MELTWEAAGEPAQMTPPTQEPCFRLFGACEISENEHLLQSLAQNAETIF